MLKLYFLVILKCPGFYLAVCWGIQNVTFFIAGKMFCLHGEEHRSLKLSQLKKMRNPDHYLYTENISKNRNGSFKQLHVKSKIVPVFACPAAGERCPFHILDTYISKLPPQAFEKDLFYIRPLETVPTNRTSPWYSAIPVGKNTLNEKVKKWCTLAGIGACCRRSSSLSFL